MTARRSGKRTESVGGIDFFDMKVFRLTGEDAVRRQKALKKPGVREEYEALGPTFEMKRQMIAMRKASGLSQEDMARLLGTQKSNISRLESLNSDVSPRLSTVEQYANALGFRVKVEFEPRAR